MPPLNPIVDVEEFPLSYRPRVLRALNGSISDLNAISSDIKSGHLPLTRATFEVFIVHLKTTDNSASRLNLVEATLRHITQFFFHPKTKTPDVSIISSIADSWPAICIWLSELHRRHKNCAIRVSASPSPGVTLPSQIADVLSLILAFIVVISRWRSMRRCLRVPDQLQQVVSILASIWASEHTKARNIYILAANAVVLLMGDDANTEEIIAAFIAHFPTKPVLAKLLLKHLEPSLKFHVPDTTHFNFEATLIGLLMTADEELREDLLLHSSIRKYAAALALLLSLPPDLNVAGSIILCLKYFNATLDATDGVTWVKKALRAGILSATIECARFYEHDGVEDEVVILISSTIPRYLVYKSVLRQVRVELDAMCLNPKFAKSSFGLTKGRARVAWSNFLKLIKERSKIKAEYDRIIKYPACSSPHCSHERTPKSNMKACEGCLSVRYCSRGCQTMHWLTHRNQCLEMWEKRKNEMPLYGRPDPEDSRLFNYIMTHDLHYNKERICEQRSAILVARPQTISSPFGILMDYRVVPVEIIVISTGSRELTAPNFPRSNSDAKRCIEKRGIETYVELYVPSGRKLHFFPSMTTILGSWDSTA
ncbi:hypothetical protein C8F04DRAFT_1134418 [Mycena alexandri]|uniref:MYND-type domain-containing protein n=1 Tax=Mycena alexandri TaxID=1745969 RepID=A0AAD6SDH3_9AGAR|nr:hypothetical protein C8F04DRAFT_1134418 [Mycena alexandri]